jgi:hypothetical protein
MSDGHFFHDMVEGIIIWEGGDDVQTAPSINAVPEAEVLHDTDPADQGINGDHAPIDASGVELHHDTVAYGHPTHDGLADGADATPGTQQVIDTTDA